MQIIGEFLAPIIQAGLDRKENNEKMTTEDGVRKPDTAHHVMLDQLLEVSDGEASNLHLDPAHRL